jgi:hypothetical protein
MLVFCQQLEEIQFEETSFRFRCAACGIGAGASVRDEAEAKVVFLFERSEF